MPELYSPTKPETLAHLYVLGKDWDGTKCPSRVAGSPDLPAMTGGAFATAPLYDPDELHKAGAVTFPVTSTTNYAAARVAIPVMTKWQVIVGGSIPITPFSRIPIFYDYISTFYIRDQVNALFGGGFGTLTVPNSYLANLAYTLFHISFDPDTMEITFGVNGVPVLMQRYTLSSPVTLQSLGLGSFVNDDYTNAVGLSSSVSILRVDNDIMTPLELLLECERIGNLTVDPDDGSQAFAFGLIGNSHLTKDFVGGVFADSAPGQLQTALTALYPRSVYTGVDATTGRPTRKMIPNVAPYNVGIPDGAGPNNLELGGEAYYIYRPAIGPSLVITTEDTNEVAILSQNPENFVDPALSNAAAIRSDLQLDYLHDEMGFRRIGKMGAPSRLGQSNDFHAVLQASTEAWAAAKTDGGIYAYTDGCDTDIRLSDFNNTTYRNDDKTHYKTAGNTVLVDVVLVPLVQTLIADLLTPPEIPGPVQNLTVPIVVGVLTPTWDALSGATSYVIKRNGITIQANFTGGTAYSDTGYTGSLPVTYSVAGKNTTGTGDFTSKSTGNSGGSEDTMAGYRTVAVTPSNDTDLPDGVCSNIKRDFAAYVVIMTEDGAIQRHKIVPGGPPIRAKRIMVNNPDDPTQITEKGYGDIFALYPKE